MVIRAFGVILGVGLLVMLDAFIRRLVGREALKPGEVPRSPQQSNFRFWFAFDKWLAPYERRVGVALVTVGAVGLGISLLVSAFA
jgi:hypothetical protein